MRNFIRPSNLNMPAGSATGFWTVIAIIGCVIRVILELTDPNNGWNRRDE